MDKKIKIITHDESFHADDVFACAVLSFWLEKKNKSFRIIRTRDEKIITSGDYIFDLGGVYDADKNRFDHHQIGGAGKRDNGNNNANLMVIKPIFIHIINTSEIKNI